MVGKIVVDTISYLKKKSILGITKSKNINTEHLFLLLFHNRLSIK